MRPPALILAALLVFAPVVGTAQIGAPDQFFRIFLQDGEALPSYGDYAVVGNRVVFALPIGTAESENRLQFMSLPTAVVDLERTARYAFSMKAERYARTRGEADYLAMTDDVSRALDEVREIEDPARRLAVAEAARERLLAWSGTSYAYRADDIRELAGMFDQVIGELRAAAGQSSFALDLSSGPPTPDFEALLPAPSFPESIGLALDAARAADITAERIAILRSTEDVVSGLDAFEPLRVEVARELEAETAADAAYAALETDVLGRARTALDAGDIATVGALRAELTLRDAELGSRRPGLMTALRLELLDLIEATMAHRLALDRYAVARAGRLDYERRVRPVLSGLDGLKPILTALREQTGTAFWRLERSISRLSEMDAALRGVEAPDDLADVHATLSSALLMARQACDRWRRFAITTTDETADEASTAAAASMMLTAKMREDLLARLFPPKAR